MSHHSSKSPICRIDIILGPMFSGKSTELLRRCSRLEAIGKNVLYINHEYDTRTDDSIQTHSKHRKNATKVFALNQISEQSFNEANVIAIDEAQFFNDLYDFVLKCEANHKTVIMSGLDGDSNRKPFGHILECIPLCDSVVKLTSMDMVDRDGTEAIFSRRIIKKDEQVCIGAEGEYIAVSRENYFREL
jgi:thymidine kinase